MKINHTEIAKRLGMLDWFKNIQLAKLLENTHKGSDFSSIKNDSLIHRLLQEVDELKEAIKTGSHSEIARECADVANFAMFIAVKHNKE